MFQKEVKQIEVKVVENKLQKYIAQAFSKDSQAHALLMAIYAAVLGAAEPFIQNWIQHKPEPDWQYIISSMAGAAVMAWMAYTHKNGANGSSNTTAIVKVQPTVTN